MAGILTFSGHAFCKLQGRWARVLLVGGVTNLWFCFIFNWGLFVGVEGSVCL